MQEGQRKEYLKGTRRHGKYRFSVAKFLKSRLGTLWSEIHSELSKEFDRRTYAGYAFWKWALQWDVAINCWIGAQTGTVYQDSKHGSERVTGYYVHPFTGILCHQKPVEKPVEKKKPITRFVIDKNTAIEKIEGIWYHTSFRKADSLGWHAQYDPERRAYIVITKRQLSAKELRAHKLTNNSPEQIKEAKIKAVELYKEAKAKADVHNIAFLASLSDFMELE